MSIQGQCNRWLLVATLSFAFLLTVLGAFVTHAEDAFPVRLVVAPGDAHIIAGEEAIVAVEASGVGLRYQWHLTGPGLLEGDFQGTAVIYKAPLSLERIMETATVIVRVTDEQGREVRKHQSFAIGVYDITFHSPRGGERVYALGPGITEVPAWGKVTGGPVTDGMRIGIKVYTDQWYRQGTVEVETDGSWVVSISLQGTTPTIVAELFDKEGKLLSSKAIQVERIHQGG